MTTAVVWFRRDLRLTDNPAWAAATSHHDRVVPLFVLDPRLWDSAGPHRGPQLLAHLWSLDDSLAAIGGRLQVRHGDPLGQVAAAASGADAVYWNADVSPYALERDRAVATALGGSERISHGGHVHPPGALTTGAGDPYRVFTPYYRRWQAEPWDKWPQPGAATVAADPGDGLPPPDMPALMAAGEAGAAVRLERFLARVDGYQELRDRPDLDATSRLSADLKYGTLGPRQIIESVGDGTPGRAALVRQLCWRDFYAQLMAAYPHTLRRPLRPEYGAIDWRNDRAEFEAWATGRTGYPIVDAGMRQLSREGWMHNRVRMITASFLVKDLLIDWRWGERHFRRLLVDGDIPQNAGNWQWVAGTGADAAPYFRIFNPVTQGRRFDPAGDYVRRYVPELARLDATAIHAPWKLGPLELEAAGIELDTTYPAPIVDHGDARTRTLAAYEAAREAAR